MTDLKKTLVAGQIGPPATVLVVDDNPVDRSLAGKLIERRPGWKARYACGGAEALDILRRDPPPDAILTDLLMEDLDGLTLLSEVRKSHPQIPVVLMTAHGSEELAMKALRSGAASYVTKRSLAQDLTDMVDQVLSAHRTSSEMQQVQASIVGLTTDYELENDPVLARGVVAQTQAELARLKLLERSRVRLGIALEEMLLSALYHGNLEITPAERQKGPADLRKLVAERRQRSPYQERRLHVRIALTRSLAEFVIRHEGRSVPSPLRDPTNPAHLNDPASRAMMLVQTFMDEIDLNPAGNQITLRKNAGS